MLIDNLYVHLYLFCITFATVDKLKSFKEDEVGLSKILLFRQLPTYQSFLADSMQANLLQAIIVNRIFTAIYSKCIYGVSISPLSRPAYSSV